MSYEYSTALGMGALGTTELARVAYDAGMSSYQARNYAAALEHFREAERQETNLSGVAISNTMTWIACCYARLNRCSEANDIFEEQRNYWSDPARSATFRTEVTTLYNQCRTAATAPTVHEAIHETAAPAQTVATTTQPSTSTSTGQVADFVTSFFHNIWGTQAPTDEHILIGPTQLATTTTSGKGSQISTTGKPGVNVAQPAPAGNGGVVPPQTPVRSPVRVELPGDDTNTWLLYGGLGIAGVALLGGILYLAFRSKPQELEGAKS